MIFLRELFPLYVITFLDMIIFSKNLASQTWWILWQHVIQTNIYFQKS